MLRFLLFQTKNKINMESEFMWNNFSDIWKNEVKTT